MAEKGGEYAKNSLEFRQKYGEELYDFYFRFFQGYTYDNYVPVSSNAAENP